MEIDDAIARNLQAAAQLVDTLQKDPKTRRGFLGLIKTVKPDVSIPELDAAAPIEEAISKLTNEISSLKTSLSQKDADADLAGERKRLKKDHAYTDEGIKELEKFMIDHNVGEHEVARLAMEASRPKPSPLRPQFSTRLSFEDNDVDGAEWMNSPDHKLDKELDKAFEAIANGLAG